MEQNDRTAYWLVYKGMRMCLGIWKMKKLRLEFLRWQAKNGWPSSCGICGGYVSRSQRSLDHIIPISICLELEMPGLIFDSRNFRIAHKDCNTERSSNISDLPKKVRQKLAEKRRNKTV